LSLHCFNEFHAKNYLKRCPLYNCYYSVEKLIILLWKTSSGNSFSIPDFNLIMHIYFSHEFQNKNWLTDGGEPDAESTLFRWPLGAWPPLVEWGAQIFRVSLRPLSIQWLKIECSFSSTPALSAVQLINSKPKQRLAYMSANRSRILAPAPSPRPITALTLGNQGRGF